MKNENNRLVGGISRYFFLLPAAVIYLSVIVAPALYSLYISFYKWNGVAPVKKFVGLKNYITLFTKDTTFQHAIRNNIIWILMTLIFTIGVALTLAMLINKSFKGRTLVRGILYLPYVLSGIVVSIIWTWVYQPQIGLLTSLLHTMGITSLSTAFLANAGTALFAVFVAALWQGVGAPMVLFLSGLQTIPAELLEASRIDGAGKFQVFRNITIPMLSETFVIVFATQIINSMKVFDIIRGMTDGGPGTSTQTLATYMVTQTFTFVNYGIGTAIAWTMVFVMMIIVVPYVMYMSKN